MDGYGPLLLNAQEALLTGEDLHESPQSILDMNLPSFCCYNRTPSSLLEDPDRHASDISREIRRFQSNLYWLGFNQLTVSKVILSCMIYLLLAVLVPIVNAVYVKCPSCDDAHKHPFDKIVQPSASILSAISFGCLIHVLRAHGLRDVLLLEGLVKDSLDIQRGHMEELRKALRLIPKIIVPFFLVELVHKVTWFNHASVEIPIIQDRLVKEIVMCSALMLSWVYRTSMFLLMCILFKLMCSLQILRLQSYYKLLEEAPPVLVILQEHMRLREQLFLISHRFRIFILFSLFTITCSQFLSLFDATAYTRVVSFFTIGDLLVCCTVQLIGFVICLHGAAKITHRSQRIVSIVSQWHAIKTCINDTGRGSSSDAVLRSFMERLPSVHMQSETYGESQDCLQLPLYRLMNSSNYRCSYEQREALVTYLQHCSAGISIYGFVLDRGFLYTIFALELSIILWTLGKTIILIK